MVARPASAGHTVPAGQLAVLAEGSWWVLVLLAECWWWCECSDEVQSEAVTIIQPVSINGRLEAPVKENVFVVMPKTVEELDE